MSLERQADRQVKIVDGIDGQVVANILREDWLAVADFFKDISNPQALL